MDRYSSDFSNEENEEDNNYCVVGNNENVLNSEDKSTEELGESRQSLVVEPVETPQAVKSKKWAHLATLQFKKGRISKAYESLTKAILLNASPTLYAKRSVVLLALREHILASADATYAINLNKNETWAEECSEKLAVGSIIVPGRNLLECRGRKAHFRVLQPLASGYFCRALASIYLYDWELALKDLQQLRDCLPQSRFCNELYIKCRNLYIETGEIPPFDLPSDIAHVPVDESFSIFDDETLEIIKHEFSSSTILLKTSLNERFVKMVIECYKRRLFNLRKKHVYMVLKNALDIFRESPNIVNINIDRVESLTVVGDLKGNFNNLMAILNCNHTPRPGRRCLFNGNLIGEDKMSLPCVVILLCMTILFPNDVFIARGSEECLESCAINGFARETRKIYDDDIVKGFAEVFNWLPLGHFVNGQILIVHGSLSESDNLIEDLQKLKRNYQPPDTGPIANLLYSRHSKIAGMKNIETQEIPFGSDSLKRLCDKNNINFIIQSQRIPNERGYEQMNNSLAINSSTIYATYLKIDSSLTITVDYARYVSPPPPDDCNCFMECYCSRSKRLKRRTCGKISLVKTPVDIPCLEESDTEIAKEASSVSIVHELSKSKTSAVSLKSSSMIDQSNRSILTSRSNPKLATQSKSSAKILSSSVGQVPSSNRSIDLIDSLPLISTLNAMDSGVISTLSIRHLFERKNFPGRDSITTATESGEIMSNVPSTEEESRILDRVLEPSEVSHDEIEAASIKTSSVSNLTNADSFKRYIAEEILEGSLRQFMPDEIPELADD